MTHMPAVFPPYTSRHNGCFCMIIYPGSQIYHPTPSYPPIHQGGNLLPIHQSIYNLELKPGHLTSWQNHVNNVHSRIICIVWESMVKCVNKWCVYVRMHVRNESNQCAMSGYDVWKTDSQWERMLEKSADMHKYEWTDARLSVFK